jgi:hypothetical protein
MVRPVIGLFMLVATTSLAIADEIYTSQGSGLFRFDPPAGWIVTKGADPRPADMPDGRPPAPRVYSVRPPDETGVMWTGLWVPTRATTIDEFAVLLRTLRPRLLSNTRVTYRDDRVVNGRQVRIVAGTGRRGGRLFDVAFAAVQLTPDRLAVVAFIGEPDVFDRHEVALSDMLATIRPVEVSR